MNRRTLYSVILSVLVLVLAIILVNPFDILMLDMALETALIVLVVVIALFAGFVWRERYADERERDLRGNAGRIAYLSGLIVLTAGIVYECLLGNERVWLLATLAVMVVTKLVAYEYFERTG
ncbi:MAG: hypothetical protein WDZ88_02335 [Candidatus Paceibacterota bacterium]